MKLTSIFLELLDSDTNYAVTVNKASLFVAEMDIGDRSIIFSAEEELPGEWIVDFAEDKDGEWSVAKTGSGNEFAVGAMVSKAFLQLIQLKNPKAIMFSAKLDEKNSRARIYTKMAKRLLGAKYEEEDVHQKSNDYKVFKYTLR